MKKLKMSFVFTVVLALILSFASCNGNIEEKDVTVNVAAIKGPTGLGIMKLMEDNSENDARNKYNFTLSSAPDEIVAKVASGEVDIAAMPTNLAANLYKKTDGGIKLAALNTLGVLYVLENGNTINSIEDLKGKTIHVSGQGATPEFILNFILKQNGIDPENDLHIVYSEEHSAIVSLCASNEIDIAILPEPSVTNVIMKNDRFRVALNLNTEYEEACNTAGIENSFFSMGCIIVRKEFLEKHKSQVNAFLSEYKASAEYVSKNVDDAAALAVKYEIIPAENIAKAAIPNCNIVFIEGEEMKSGIEQFYKVLYEADPKSIGGALPDENFYYIR